MLKIAGAVLLAASLSIPSTTGSVSVVYAGSLTAVMEGPIATGLLAREHLHFSGEGKGSKALAVLIGAGLRNPDVFISADPQLLEPLRTGQSPQISAYTVFGSARMVLGYSERSPHRAAFEAAARKETSILAVLSNPAIKIGRTDPQLDPKGSRTLRTLDLLGRHYGRSKAAKGIAATERVFPEEDLLVRVESGELDGGFFYSTETGGKRLGVLELPADSNLSTQITYAAAVLRDAPNPAGARAFITYILHGEGRRILERAGLRYFPVPLVVH